MLLQASRIASGANHKQGGCLMSSKLKFLGAIAAAALLSSSAQAQLANEKNLTLAMAQAIANGAMEKCKSMGFKVSVAVIDRAGRSMTYSSAGHPPPILKPIDGVPSFLPGSACVPLGVERDTQYVKYTAPLDGAALLMFYTDGLTEVDRDPVQGEAAIAHLLSGEEVLYAANPARFASRLIAGKRARDDMAILTVRFGQAEGRWAFDVQDSAAAYAIKRDFVAAVTNEYGSAADINACEMIFSELVGNVLRYAPGRLSLGLSVDDRGIWLHVMDDGPGFNGPPSLPNDLWSESGRGLFLVAALGEEFHIKRLPVYGTYVKVLLPRKTPTQPAE